MRAVDFEKRRWHARSIAQFLRVVVFVAVVMRNIEMQRAAKSDIEHLQPATNRQEGHLLFQRFREHGKLPRIARGIGIFDQPWVGHRLSQKFLGNIRTAGEQEAVDLFPNHFFGAGIPETHLRIRRESPRKVGFIDLPDPRGDIFQITPSYSEKGAAPAAR